MGTLDEVQAVNDLEFDVDLDTISLFSPPSMFPMGTISAVNFEASEAVFLVLLVDPYAE